MSQLSLMDECIDRGRTPVSPVMSTHQLKSLHVKMAALGARNLNSRHQPLQETMAIGHPPLLFSSRPRSDILENKDDYNTNNHPFANLPPRLQALEKAQKPASVYAANLQETKFSLWRPILTSLQNPPTPISLPAGLSGTIPLTASACRLLKEAITIGMQVGRISQMHKEDVDDLLLPLLQPYFQEPGRQYFVRMDECSPKDGVNKMGPYGDPGTVIEGLVTSVRCFKAIRNMVDDDEKPVYSQECIHMVPWRDDVHTENEWRMFVPPSGRVRAISQYTERDVGWSIGTEGTRSDLSTMVGKIMELGEELRRKAEERGVRLPAEGYVLDVHAKKRKGEWIIEPVELNGFGAQMSSGSGLFNWLWDWERMYGGGDLVELRVVGNRDTI